MRDQAIQKKEAEQYKEEKCVIITSNLLREAMFYFSVYDANTFIPSYKRKKPRQYSTDTSEFVAL